MNNPMLEESSIVGAMHVLVNITAGENFSLPEFEEVVKTITESAHENAVIKAGWIIDNSLDDRIVVTVIAAGFGCKANAAADSRGKRGAWQEEASKEQPKRSERTDFLFTDEFEQITGHVRKGVEDKHGDYFDIPTVLRENKEKNPYQLVDEIAKRKQAV